MTTLHDSTITAIASMMRTLSHILHKAEAKPDSAALLSARLCPDMYPVTDQVRIATQWSEDMTARLVGREKQKFEGDLDSFAKCYERIDLALKSLNAADKDKVNERATHEETTPMGPGREAVLSNAVYAHNLALPQIYFHVITAYAILRAQGVDIGKMDYFTGILPVVLGS